MADEEFIDYYEILQLSPKADRETIERVYRHLAKRWHPDNPLTGDKTRFNTLMDAARILTDEERRAAFDVRHQEEESVRWRLVEEASDQAGIESDKMVRHRALSILYVARRREVENPGVGDYTMEQSLGIPTELLQFHLWYMRNKGWIERDGTGLLMITVTGVDEVEGFTTSAKLITHDPGTGS